MSAFAPTSPVCMLCGPTHSPGALDFRIARDVRKRPITKRLQIFSATLALVAGALFIWLHYDLGMRELKEAVDNAVAAEKASAAGKLLMRDIVDGPSEALTVFIGLVVTLTVGAASFKGWTGWLILLWAFVLGLISFPLMGAFDSIGSFDGPIETLPRNMCGSFSSLSAAWAC